MNSQHQELAAGRWQKYSLAEQLANTGSEVSRALNWKAKQNEPYARQAFIRALELLDLTIADPRHQRRLKELLRLRECLADYFDGANQYLGTEAAWRKYFDAFGYLARKNLSTHHSS